MALRETFPAILLLCTMTSLPAGEPVSFIKQIAPILMTRCAGCHGPKKAEGGYRAHTFEFLTTAGDSETPPIVAGQPEASLLLQRVAEQDVDLRMPQDDDPLSPTDVSRIKQWIQEGALFDGTQRQVSFRALMPPRQHPPAPQRYRVPVPVLALAFSPDGKQLATGGYHEITVWDSTSGALLKRIANLPQRIQKIVWTADGKLLVGGGTPGEYGEISLVDVARATRERVFGTFEDIVLSVASNPQQNRVAAGSASTQSRVYDRQSGDQLWEAQVHSDLDPILGE